MRGGSEAVIALVLFLTLSAGTCAEDAECVLMTRCSCDCCKSDEAMTKKEAAAERRRCGTLGPCDRTGCNDMACPAEKPAVAVCKNGKCAKVPRPPK